MGLQNTWLLSVTKVQLFKHVVTLLVKTTLCSAREQKEHLEVRVENYIVLIRQGDWRRSDRLIFIKTDLCLSETLKRLWMNIVPDNSLLINYEKILKFIYSSFINSIVTRHSDSRPLFLCEEYLLIPVLTLSIFVLYRPFKSREF